ncbi:GNAT family N-acetyltransferase [Limimaricola pyoseonensis]|uniref:Ribosomal protein S18 acetylase RimI n=1 Tax=Limimaricola pyoseonensis TaxID=521013 RepID=A0A1G7H0Z9_9RHOB|nr:GNAT family N-acetyltransferase [Limimaricola pyoseonensis]SDE94021.1 Ribosomal protein S18 acetylase RimI [Limimaricola pyoseonensis]
MKTEFREAQREDVPQVVTLLADDALGRGRETGDMAGYLAAFDAMQAEPGNRLYVAVTGERVVACYQLAFIQGLSLAAARRAQIEGVRVAAEMRGQGLGRRLLADAEARARAAGCALMQLTSNATRADARRFYEAAGYAASHVGFKKPLN